VTAPVLEFSIRWVFSYLFFGNTVEEEALGVDVTGLFDSSKTVQVLFFLPVHDHYFESMQSGEFV